MSEMTIKKKKGLGRGLEVLLGSAPDFSADPSPVSSLPITRLQAGKYQPRNRMDEGALNELAQSIREQGVMQPILVRPVSGSGNTTVYEIIAGERRYRAAQIAGLSDMPVIVKDVDDQTAAAMALIENMQREDLNPLEEAQGIHRLITDFEFTHEQAASAVGRSRSAVSNLLRLLNLTRPVQTMLVAGDIDMGHARALLAVDGATQIALATQIVAKRMSVREAEKLVAQELNNRNSVKKVALEKSADLVQLEEELSDLLATKVSFRLGSKGRGQLVIDFANLDILDGLIQKIRPMH
ncbi:putative chromosome-partitioning protein ParB [Oxalobacter formigenes]|uniref:ParB-like protein n=2 Tax=Oxalobacter formigenes TaxID=847 RepID=C3XC50_OXAFO|nr:putative chromosome-partitioning protein ParB [Oxalobacter formigenes]EEO30776.1 ParB-like protein [Oxalobacter formigenes OXCC13]